MQTAVVALIVVAALVGTAHAQPPVYVTRVVDGDTLYGEIGGRIEAVRYLGINSPRIEHPSHGPEWYAAAAREANRRLVEGKWVYLLFEGPPRDRHGRLLAYVWVGDVFVNATLVHLGYGEAALASHAAYAAYFRSVQDGAQRDGRGLWREQDAQAYHRPRPTEFAADEEGGPATVGGRVFSAPAPFIPVLSPGSSPSSLGGSPSYVAPTGSMLR